MKYSSVQFISRVNRTELTVIVERLVSYSYASVMLVNLLGVKLRIMTCDLKNL